MGDDNLRDIAIAAHAAALLGKLDITTASSTYVPQAVAQAVEHTAAVVFTVAPVTAGFAPFQVHENSFDNTGAGAGTVNHTLHLGWNASRHSAGPGTVNGKPAIYMGFEDNYYDDGGDARYGVEWYVGYVSPDGTSSPVGALRPFYSRVFAGNADHSATTFMEIGTDGTGSWQVRTAIAAPIIYATGAAITLYKTTTVVAGTFTLAPTSGSAQMVLNGVTYSQINLQVNGAASFALAGTSTTNGGLYDKDSRAHLGFTYGATAAVALTSINSKAIVQGVLAVGASSGTPTLAVTANDGGSPPTPTVTGNSARGTIGFGTGTAPAVGAIITVTLPTGAYAATPQVVVCPANFLTASKQSYAIMISATQFQICLGGTPAASQAADTYLVSYVVIG